MHICCISQSTVKQGCPQDIKSQDRDETKTFQKTSQDRSVAVKNTKWWSLSLNNLFLACQIHYFLLDISALHGCWQDLKSRNPETEMLYLQDQDKTETLNPRDRDVWFFKLLRPRRDRDVQPSRLKWDLKCCKNVSRDRLETETFKTRLHPCCKDMLQDR